MSPLRLGTGKGGMSRCADWHQPVEHLGFPLGEHFLTKSIVVSFLGCSYSAGGLTGIWELLQGTGSFSSPILWTWWFPGGCVSIRVVFFLFWRRIWLIPLFFCFVLFFLLIEGELTSTEDLMPERCLSLLASTSVALKGSFEAVNLVLTAKSHPEHFVLFQVILTFLCQKTQSDKRIQDTFPHDLPFFNQYFQLLVLLWVGFPSPCTFSWPFFPSPVIWERFLPK